MKRRDGFDPLAIVSKIAEQEKELNGTTFIAPYVGSGKVRLRLSGIVYEMDASGCPEGWAIMEVRAVGKASFVQAAPLTMVQNYLRLFPQMRLVMIDQFSDKHWWALSAAGGKQKIQLNGPVPVQLAERVGSFDTVYCRFDGATFWYEAADRRRDPGIARNLRKALAEDISPDELHCSGMVPQERLAYKMLYLDKHKNAPAPETMDDRTRIARALEHSGAQLDRFSYQNGGDDVSVHMRVGDRLHVVQVRTADLSVVSAGICLSGQDRNFDLSSLVGVLREAESGDYYFDD